MENIVYLKLEQEFLLFPIGKIELNQRGHLNEIFRVKTGKTLYSHIGDYGEKSFPIYSDTAIDKQGRRVSDFKESVNFFVSTSIKDIDTASSASHETNGRYPFKSIDEGYSIGIFPEGGIKTEKVPTMAPFKNGAFAMALEKQIPILPVSLLGAYKIMKGSFYISWSPCEIICHKPISTDGFSTKDVDKFRDKCYKILQAELDKSYQE